MLLFFVKNDTEHYYIKKGAHVLKKQNKGFTMVELLIIIAVIAILAPMFVTSMADVFTSSASEAAEDASSLLSFTRVATLSGEIDPYVEIYYDSTENNYYGIFVANGEQEQIEIIGSSSVEIHYTTTDETRVKIESGAPLRLEYDNTGALLSPKDIKSIDFSSGSALYVLDITPATGYHTVIKY